MNLNINLVEITSDHVVNFTKVLAKFIFYDKYFVVSFTTLLVELITVVAFSATGNARQYCKGNKTDY